MPLSAEHHSQLLEALHRYWGYESFRPLQAESMSCVLANRDSVVVLPTGGGKSLCYQVPAVCSDGLAVVVSPLIALMKDQVDGLKTCGVPAAFINSTQSSTERYNVANDVRVGRLKLLYISPERLVQDKTIEFLSEVDVRFIAIDEAHCISEWGHDFRVEYRQLNVLREHFPQIGIHAFTATATEQVRRDIARQLQLRDPEVLVGSFDRPNLVYRTDRRDNLTEQVRNIIDRHRNESGIIYCTSRRETEDVAALLNGLGYQALAYHAGMDDHTRRENQESFINESIDIIVATVAFGMGIDKSNVRFVIHVGMPKSLENYQQESGRGGRDGLQAECCLIYSMQDFMRWKRTIEDASSESRGPAMRSLQAMADYANGIVCRHRKLVSYFGQEYEKDNCGACDICLQEMDLVDSPLIVGQKILSSVYRQGQRFGVEHTALVLKGSKSEQVLRNEHDKLSTYGLLKDEAQGTIREWIEQLISQEFLVRVGEYNLLEVTPRGWQLLKGEITPKLMRPADGSSKERNQTRAAKVAASWDGVDRALFDELRIVRHDLAVEHDVPAYVIFTDESLRDMARYRPSTLDGLSQIKGVGEKRLADYGEQVLSTIVEYCENSKLPVDNWPSERASARRASSPRDVSSSRAATPAPASPKGLALQLFADGKTIDEVMSATQRARSTCLSYLCEYIRSAAILDASPWVGAEAFQRVCKMAAEAGDIALKPIFDGLNAEVSYEVIHIAVECYRNQVGLHEEAAT